MLKKIITLLFLTSTFLLAQDFTGIRIYINPGHGGHDSDDRYIAATGFWESEGNLTKGLYLKDILDSLGATTKISRTTNNTSDDLGLSVISADANNFDADFFHSIHSNAFNGQSNYTLMLYKEVNGSPAFSQAKQMCDIMGSEIQKAHRTTTKYTRGDLSFLGFNLGVLRNLTMPGTLSEGSFHDYIPESWRLKNDVYLKHEAWAITKAFITYFSLTPLPFGEIAGILRDPFDSVPYYYISSTSDGRRPLNYGKATLMPDSIVYEGDSFNNGFYLLDKINPGTYNLILEAEDYEKDTVSVTVTAGKTVFKDKYLTPKPNYSAPVVVNILPDNTGQANLDAEIIIEFSIKMDKTSVEQAFSVSPNVQGTFRWESNDRRMIFTPSEFLQPETEYTVSITNWAKSFYDVLMENSFTYTFTTRPGLKLISSFPFQDAVDVSTTVNIKMKFNAAIDYNSLGGKVALEDIDGNFITPYIGETDYANGWIIFEPRDPLKNNAYYQVKLLSGIKDKEGTVFNSDTTIIFKTEPETVVEGTTLLDFEEISVWWQPGQDGSTSGVNLDNSSFTISTTKFVEGTHSGKLAYEFVNEENGLCRVFYENEPKIPTATNNRFGMWVFGDFSQNYLEFWFRNNSGTNIPIFIDTLNWTGWKFKEVDLSGLGELTFHSLVIKQNPLGEKHGNVFFDAMLADVTIVTDINTDDNNLPTNFRLEQNYPNPFNPSTTIKYSIPRNAGVGTSHDLSLQLKIYDVLGREVATLINEQQKPGNYEITFDASSLTSGVYYYQLKAGDFLDVKKMLLLK